MAANPVLIMLLIPFFSYVGYPLLNRVFRLTPLRKISIGMFVMVAAYVFSAWIQSRIDAGGKPSIGWMFIGYVILTSSEVMVSITSLEFSIRGPVEDQVVHYGDLPAVDFGQCFTAAVNAVIVNEDGSSKPAGSHYFLFCEMAKAVVLIALRPVIGKDVIQDES